MTIADAHRRRQADAARLALVGQIALLVRLDKFVHLAEGRDAGDRLLAEWPGEGDGAKQLAVDVNRATAHAGDDAGLFEVGAAEAAQDHVAAWTGVAQDADYLGVERIDFGPFDAGLSLAFHAGADFVHIPVRLRLGIGNRSSLSPGNRECE
jgi:hypothetical protein